MDRPALLALSYLAVACACYGAGRLLNRGCRSDPPDPDPAARLLGATTARDMAAYRAQVAHHTATKAVVDAATDIVDAEHARHTRNPTDGGSTP